MAKVLPKPYSFKKARNMLKEIVDHMVLELIEQNLTCNQIVLDVQYDKESLEKVQSYNGPMSKDSYGRSIPKMHIQQSIWITTALPWKLFAIKV